MRSASISRLVVGWLAATAAATWTAAAGAGCGTGDVALGGPGTLVRIEHEVAGVNCDDGGLAINTGLDTDGDTFLDDSEITSVQYVCNGIAPVQCQGGRVLTGIVTVRGEADWDQLAGVHCVDGDLLVVGLASDSMPDLADLGVVTGDVVIAANPQLTSLDGLGAIREVGGVYLIQGNDALVGLAGLGSIQRMRSIAVVGNNGMLNLSGLEQLTQFGGGIRITNNAALTDLTGLDNLVRIAGAIAIHSNRRDRKSVV